MNFKLPIPVLLIVLASLLVAFAPLPDAGWLPFAPVAGPRGVLIVRESAKDTPAFARLATGLRIGEPAAYITAKGHTLDILDVDSEAKVVAEFKPAIAGLKLPAAAVYDSKSRRVLDKQAVADNVTPADFLAWLKGNGG